MKGIIVVALVSASRRVVIARFYCAWADLLISSIMLCGVELSRERSRLSLCI